MLNFIQVFQQIKLELTQKLKKPNTIKIIKSLKD